MQADPRIIETLNDVLTAELTAVNQYFIHAKMCANWGFERLADHVQHESIDEMKHADRLIEGTLFLDAPPNMQRLVPIKVEEAVREQFELDLQVEREAVQRFNAAIALAVSVGDNATRARLEEMLVSEEEHAD